MTDLAALRELATLATVKRRPKFTVVWQDTEKEHS